MGVPTQATQQEALLLISFGFPDLLYNSMCLPHLHFFRTDEAFCHCGQMVAIWGWSTLMKGFLFCILLSCKGIYLHVVPDIQLPVPVTHLSTLIFLPIPFPPLILSQGPHETQHFYSQDLPTNSCCREANRGPDMHRLVYQKAGLYGEKPQKAGIHNRLCNSLP